MNSGEIANNIFSKVASLSELDGKISDAQGKGNLDSLGALREEQASLRTLVDSMRHKLGEAKTEEAQTTKKTEEARSEAIVTKEKELEELVKEFLIQEEEKSPTPGKKIDIQEQNYGYEEYSSKQDKSDGLSFLGNIPYAKEDEDE